MPHSPRPPLSLGLSLAEFQAHYWLKTELLDFCRHVGLPRHGGKLEIAARIEQVLATGRLVSKAPDRRPKRLAPPRALARELTRETVIGPGFRCSQQARAFFEAAIGPSFHFSTAFQAFLRAHPEETLQDAIDEWHRLKAAGRQQKELAPQFQYNRHMQEFFRDNPLATREEAIAAWWRKRGRPS